MIDEEKEVEQTESEKEAEAFVNLKYDYKKAKDAKPTIDKLITEWNDLYYGKKKGTGEESELIMREIAKAIENMKPSITEPFTSSSNPIRIQNTKSESAGRIMEKYANYQFTQEFDRETFIEELTDVLLREGTVWVKDGWKYKEDTKTLEFKGQTIEELILHTSKYGEPSEIEENDDGTFDAEFEEVQTLINKPTAEVCRNEHIFPDPSARNMKECRYIIHKHYKTIAELKVLGWCDEKAMNKLEGIDTADREDTDLGNVRNADAGDYGLDETYQPKDNARKKIAIIEYWGEYDLNKDGKTKQIVARWSEKDGVNFKIDDNPLPHNEIPFQNQTYSARPFSLWGNALAYFLADYQRVKTGITRGIMNNMSNANNGQKFIKRGALDFINMKRMRNGDKHIIVNSSPSEMIQDGSYNALPQSVFQTLEVFNRESRDMIGTDTSGTQSGNANADEDTQQLTMAQQRMASTVRGIENVLRKMVNHWLQSAHVFLDNEQIEELFTEDEQQDYMAFKMAKTSKIKMKVGTGASRQVKLQQLNMLMQQSNALEGKIPEDQLSNLVAEMMEEFDMYDEASKLRAYKPEPTEMQMMMQQMEIQAKQFELSKMQLENAKLQAEIQQVQSDAQLKQVDAQATLEYKRAQTAEKYAKANKHEVETALKPAEVLSTITDTNQPKGET